MAAIAIAGKKALQTPEKKNLNKKLPYKALRWNSDDGYYRESTFFDIQYRS